MKFFLDMITVAESLSAGLIMIDGFLLFQYFIDIVILTGWIPGRFGRNIFFFGLVDLVP